MPGCRGHKPTATPAQRRMPGCRGHTPTAETAYAAYNEGPTAAGSELQAAPQSHL